MDTNPHFCSMHWRLRGAAEALFEKRPSDVAHEYFNYNARPAYFKDTAATLAPAGLAWAAHWSPTKIIDGLDLTPRQATFLNGIVEPHRREQLRDFALNTARRLDIWSKFAADEQRYARDELMGKLGFILVRPSDDFDFKIAGVLGEVALSRRLYAPLLEFLATLRPTTVEALRERLADISLDELYEALCILVDKEMIQVCAANGATAARAVGPARALNAAIIARAPESDEIAYLGSPVTGSGLRVSRLHQIFLLAEQDGARDTSDLAHFAASRLKPCGSRPIPPECSSADLLEREAEMFVRRWRPFFVALGLVDQRVSGNSRS